MCVLKAIEEIELVSTFCQFANFLLCSEFALQSGFIEW